MTAVLRTAQTGDLTLIKNVNQWVTWRDPCH